MQARISASDGADGDDFGHAVSINGDTALVGAPKDDDACPQFRRGLCLCSRRVRAGTSKQNFHGERTRHAPMDSGESVSLRGNTAIIGAPQTEHAGVKFAGAAYVFEREGDSMDWRKFKLTAE